MWRRWLMVAPVLIAGVGTVGCQSTAGWMDGGNYLSSLPFAGGAPLGQTEPELVYEQKPAAD